MALKLVLLIGSIALCQAEQAPPGRADALAGLELACSEFFERQHFAGSPAATEVAESVPARADAFTALFEKGSGADAALNTPSADDGKDLIEASNGFSVVCKYLLKSTSHPASAEAAEGSIDITLKRSSEFDAEEDNILDESFEAIGRRLAADPWYAQYESFYAAPMVVAIGVVLVVVFIQESVVVRSTLVWSPSKLAEKTERSMRDIKLTLKGDDESDDDVPIQKPDMGSTISKKILTKDSKHRQTFFNFLQKEVDHRFETKGDSSEPVQEPQSDVVGFSTRTFVGLEAEQKSLITVERSGQLKGRAVVKVKATRGKESGGFSAKENVDFTPIDQEVVFEENERVKNIEIKLLPTDTTWSPTRWFNVELYEVVSGDVILGGPTVSSADSQSMTAIVLVLQDDMFPCEMPEDKRDDDMWLLWYYYKERMRARKAKFWKTMGGLMYEPVHSTVVTPLVQAFIIDWAASPDDGGGSPQIIFLACIQLLSYLFLRQGDVLQVRNRGRTGGCRQLHRTQLLSKLLMMDHPEQYEYPGDDWFYSGLMNVDVMVKDGYWQMYAMSQSLWGLVLCVAVLIWKAAYKASKKGEDLQAGNMVPAVFLLVITPLAFLIIKRRGKKVSKLLVNRMEREGDWVEIFAWLAENGQRLFTSSFRERARIEKYFDQKSKDFVKDHQRARDFGNDSTWVTKWIGACAYCMILIWAATRLLQSRQEIHSGFEAGDCILLIQLFDKFTKYLTKVSNSFVAMQRGAVSLRRVEKLLKLKEQKSLLELRNDRVDADEPLRGNSMKFENVVIEVPDRKDGLGPVTKLIQTGAALEIPLGKVVLIKGGSEAQRFTLMAAIAKLVRPAKGKIVTPSSAWSIFLPSEQMATPFGSVKEDFMVSGASEQSANNLAELFDLDPDSFHIRLPHGKASSLAMGKALLRDPTILITVRPLRLVPPEMRKHVMNLLLTWQSSGGSRTLLKYLENPEQGEFDADKEEERLARENLRTLRQPRTLIIADDELGLSYVNPERVFELDLSKHFEGPQNRL